MCMCNCNLSFAFMRQFEVQGTNHKGSQSISKYVDRNVNRDVDCLLYTLHFTGTECQNDGTFSTALITSQNDGCTLFHIGNQLYTNCSCKQ